MRFDLLKVLETANKIEDKDKLVSYLKENMNYHLEVYLAAMFNPNIEFEKFYSLNYKKSPLNKIGFSESSIELQLRRLYIFQKSVEIPFEKKKEILVKSLELMCEEHQNLYLSIIRKINNYKNITKPIVKKVAPHVLEPNYVLRRP